MIQCFQLFRCLLAVLCGIFCLLLQSCHIHFAGIQHRQGLLHIFANGLRRGIHRIYLFLNCLRLGGLLLDCHRRFLRSHGYLFHGALCADECHLQFVQFYGNLLYRVLQTVTHVGYILQGCFRTLLRIPDFVHILIGIFLICRRGIDGYKTQKHHHDDLDNACLQAQIAETTCSGTQDHHQNALQYRTHIDHNKGLHIMIQHNRKHHRHYKDENHIGFRRKQYNRIKQCIADGYQMLDCTGIMAFFPEDHFRRQRPQSKDQHQHQYRRSYRSVYGLRHAKNQHTDIHCKV